MKSNIKALRQRKTELTQALRAALDKSAADNDGVMIEAEATRYEDNLAKLVAVEKSLEREELQLERERNLGSAVSVDDDTTTQAIGTPANDKNGFQSFGEMLCAVVRAGRSGGTIVDPRLMQAAANSASGLNEATPSEGGFLVRKDYSAELIKKTYEQGQISSKVRRLPVGENANGLRINAIDETSRVDGSRWGGVLSYWINEADALTATKPKFRQIELNLHKLIGLCYATDELLQDAAALEAVIMESFPEEMVFKLEDAIISGTGSGQPLGILNSAALITQAKDSADSTATISTKDILAMWQRMWARSALNANWFINQDVTSQLYQLTLGAGTAVQLLYTPPGMNGNTGQYGKLLGRDVIPTEHNSTLGTVGDIILADMSQYLMIDKGSPQAASSIHVRFLNDETTFRFVYRTDGQPAWNKALTPKNGSNTTSPFVALATRP